MTSDLSCGMNSSHFFWHFKTLNPSKLSDYITLSFQGNQFCLIYLRMLNIKETQRFTVRNYTVLLYLVPTSQEVSVKARANQMQM